MGLRLGSIYALVALFQFTQRTRLGRAMRCVSEDKEAATLMGINVNHTILAAMVMFPVNYQIKNGAWVALLSASVRGVFQYPMLVYAILLIIIIVFRPKGIFGAYEFSLRNLPADLKASRARKAVEKAERKEAGVHA